MRKQATVATEIAVLLGVGRAGEEGSEPEEMGENSDMARGSKPGDGTLGTQTANES